MHDLVGGSSPKSLKLQGTIGSHTLQILVDSGATLNFIHPKWIDVLNITLDTSKFFDIFIGNGQCMHCSSVCHEVNLRINSIVFVVNLFVTPFHEVDIVLGVDWLNHLGPITFSYERMTIFFNYNGSW